MTLRRASMLVAVLTLGSYGLGWAAGVPWLLPVLNAAGAWWLMARLLRSGHLTRAIATMLLWAAMMAVIATTMAAGGLVRSADGDSLFLRADYRDEMLHWVRTGEGAESEPRTFVPRQLVQSGVFALASTLTGGVAAMPMGAMLTNSMGDYVGAMASESAHPVVSVVLGWHPWAIVRIAGFVILGVVLSGIMLSRVMGFPFQVAACRGWIATAVGLLLLDMFLKAVLAPTWGRLLRGVAGW